MHDFSISKQIAVEVLNKAKKEKAAHVLEIHIKIGSSTHLNPEQVRFWLQELFKKTIAEQARIVIVNVPVVIRCKECSYEGKIETSKEFYYSSLFNLTLCPACTSRRVEMKSGGECLLEKVKIKRRARPNEHGQ